MLLRSGRNALLLVAFAILAVACAPNVPVNPQGTSVASHPSSSVAATAARSSASPAASARRSPTARDLAMVDAQRLVGDRVKATLHALALRDGALLASLAHESKGVRLSPRAFVRVDTDQVLTRTDLARAFTDTATRTWGIADGIGTPIVLSYARYHEHYVYARDFEHATWISYNHAIGSGNTIDNTAEVYPNAIMFEAYDPGPDPARADFQWQSLRLLFEQSGNDWYLIAIVHAEWSI